MMQGGRGEFQSGWVMSTSTCCTDEDVLNVRNRLTEGAA